MNKLRSSLFSRLISQFFAALVLLALITPLLSQAQSTVTISEFLARNHNYLADEDGAFSDWIELYNDGTTAVNLAGWYLTDDATNLTKWMFPATNIPAKSFLIVFASAKNRAVPGQPLHTSFSLDGDGGFLGLVLPDGLTLVTAINYGPQTDDISYGVAQNIQVTSLLTSGAPARVLIPANGALGLTWVNNAFPDNLWIAGTNGVGYETSVPGFAVTNYKANVIVDSLTAALNVIATPSQRSATYIENSAVINYVNTGASANYANDRSFPGLSIGADVEDFVVDAVGTITIPAAGNWTFGVNSDDGFQLNVGSFTMSAPDPRGPTDSLQTFNFPAAGRYSIRLVYYERGGGSEVELFAAPGVLQSWNATDFRLVGDTANGGLAVRSQALPGSYDASFRSVFVTDVQSQMLSNNSSAYIRIPFPVQNAAAFSSLTLQMKYADGFIAYLNGQEVARRSAPAAAAWNSTATGDRTSAAALTFENINISGQVGLLQDGSNLLAIQGLNSSSTDPDFLIFAALTEFKITGNTNRFFDPPTPNAANGAGFVGFVGDTKFSHDRGFYSTNFSLTISSATSGATIRYTTNGSSPTASTGLIYTGPIPVSRTMVVRAAAFLDGYRPSDVDCQTYLFLGDILGQSPNGQVPWAEWPQPGSAAQVYDYGMDPDIVNDPTWGPQLTNALTSVPSFSIVMDLRDLFDPSRGIYANPSGDEALWERPGSVELINPDGTQGFQINCGIRIRGGFSRDPNNPKHAFRFFFRQQYGASKLKYPLFGENGAQEFDKMDLRTFQNYSWSYQNDARCIMLRDQFSRDAQLAMSGNAERGEFYHLYINGQYWGLYNTDERPEASFGATYYGGNRDDWDAIKVDPDLGYVIEPTDGNLDAWTRLWMQATNGFASDANYYKVQGRNPDGSINPSYENLLDVDQLIDYMLIILYGGNLDAPISNFLSNQSPNNTFGIRDRLGLHGGFRFFAHDSEHTLLNVNEDRNGPYPAGSPTGGGLPKSNAQYFWQQLQANAEFKMLIADHVQKHCLNGGILSPQGALAQFLIRSNQITQAVVAESARWGDAKRTVPFNWNDWRNQMVTVGRDFIGPRTGVLLTQLRSRGLYPSVAAPIFSQFGGAVPSGYSLSITNPNATGTIYYTLDGSDPRIRGGAISNAAVVYGGPITLTSHTFVRARIKDGANWSALVEAHFYPAQDFASLLLSELMYNPTPAGAFQSDDLEFLELKNTGTNVIDLSGSFFSSGITFAFTNGTRLLPGQFFVIGRNPTALTNRYPGLVVNGTYTGKLDNGGETVTLSTALGTTILSVSYDDVAPWPLTADGHGFSLVPVNSAGNPNYNLASNWRASTGIGGSPGSDDPASSIAPVLINELLTHTDALSGDAIELFNPTATDVNIGGWFLTDDPAILTKFRIPDGTVIAAQGYRVFYETDFNPTPGTNNSFALSSLGEEVYLLSGDANTNLTGWSHGVSFGAAATNVSFGRYIISTGEEQFPAQAAATLGAANAGPRVGPVVINEIMYHPDVGFDEFVELLNISANSVPLFDPDRPTNTWKLTGLGYTFPTNVVLGANQLLLLSPIDPEAFRSKYLVPAGVQIVGPYPGVLQDSGEHLELKFPGGPTTNSTGAPIIPYITMDDVRYNDKAPWPPAADGGGPSLQRLNSAAYGNDPINWFTSGVTPGRSNAVNVGPTVSITSPPNNSIYNAPANVPISADANDPDGAIVKVEFYADGVKIGEDASAPYSIVWTNALTGTRSLTARAIDSSFATLVSAPVLITVNPYPVGTGTGLQGEYYDNMDLTALKVTRIDPVVNVDWGTGSPDPSIGVDTFSARWTGLVQPRLSDIYYFYTTSDDGIRLWINNQQIINNWTDHGPTEDSAPIALTAGQPYLIKMEFYENGGGATAQLRWSATGLPKEVIPQTQLYPFTNTDLTIARQPQGTNIVKGRNLTLNVLATGFTDKSYQWFFNQTNLLVGATNSSLTITNIQVTNSGSYRVVITDPNTNLVSASAIVTVIEPPVAISPATPVRGTITAGDSLTLTVSATGTLPITYNWRRNFTSFTNMVLLSNTCTIVLSNVQPVNLTSVAATNSYTIRLTNIAGEPLFLHTNAIIRVLNPPVITNQPVSQTTGVGSNVTFSVGARGGAPQRNQWFKNGVSLLNQTNASLNLTNVQIASEGTYSVLITNLDGTATSTNALLIIDSDRDGIPDSYELAHHMNPNDRNDATGDLDGDGMLNRDEFIAGTDPEDPASYLRIDAYSGVPNGVVLRFLAISNRAYTVESRLNADAGTWTPIASVPAAFATNRLISLTNAPAGTNQQVYRLGTQKVQ